MPDDVPQESAKVEFKEALDSPAWLISRGSCLWSLSVFGCPARRVGGQITQHLQVHRVLDYRGSHRMDEFDDLIRF